MAFAGTLVPPLEIGVSNTCPLQDGFCVTHLLIQCLNLLSDYLLSLRPLDVEFMRRLSKVVNIVPVIAKADTLTLEERDFFKKKVASPWLHFLCIFSGMH